MQYRYLLLAIVLAVPSAAATWNMKGHYEPDTANDKTDGLMATDADVEPCYAHGYTGATGCATNTVYFTHITDVIDGPSVGNEAMVSPNVATLQTSFGSPQEEDIAMLGVWKDCNKDGYVGLGDQGLFEYRSEVLTAMDTAHVAPGTSICPVQHAPTTADPTHGLVHNDGTWVHEWIPIGYNKWVITHKSFDAPNNLFMLLDPAARVWGDDGLPGANVRNICWISPSPIGTLHSVGSIEDAADCRTGSAIAKSVAPVIGGSPLGPTYATARATHNPWGEVSDPTAAYVFDCRTTLGPGETVGGFHFQARMPAPRVGTGTSPSGTVREVGNELDDCNSADDISSNQWEYQAANGPYAKETNRVTAQSAGDKIQADQPLFYTVGQRQNLPGESTVLGPTAGADAGLSIYYSLGVWQSQSLDATTPWQYERGCVPDPQMGGHNTCTAGTVDTGLAYKTFYAYVSPVIGDYTLSFPGGAQQVRTYGSEACDGFTSGIHGIAGSAPGVGWECDGKKWYVNLDGSNSNYFDPSLCTADGHDVFGNGPTTIAGSQTGCFTDPVTGQLRGAPMGGSPGWVYDLRDVDCYDSSVGAARSAGVSWGTVSGQSC